MLVWDQDQGQCFGWDKQPIKILTKHPLSVSVLTVFFPISCSTLELSAEISYFRTTMYYFFVFELYFITHKIFEDDIDDYVEILFLSSNVGIKYLLTSERKKTSERYSSQDEKINNFVSHQAAQFMNYVLSFIILKSI